MLVTDIRMPPSFNREGIDAAKEVRKRHPGTGIVILSQYDDPEYAVSLLAEGSAGYGYLLKDHLAEGNQLVEAIRTVATGGTALDPSIVESLMRPVTSNGELTNTEESLLAFVAEGKPIKAIAAARRTPPEAVDAQVEDALLQACGRSESRATRALSIACASSIAPSWTARSRARPCRDCCPAESPRNFATRAAASARPNGST